MGIRGRRLRGRMRGGFTPLSSLDPDTLVVGVDEVGLGPVAGPLIACAVMFRAGHTPIPGVRDSKKLSEKQREKVHLPILEQAVDVGFGIVRADELGEIGMGRGHKEVLLRAVRDLEIAPEHLYIDGNLHLEKLPHAEKVVGGDDRLWIISAASVLAKQQQTYWMEKILAKRYPQYGFERHHGYLTAQHTEALRREGPCPAHRTCMKPIQALLRRKA